MKEVLPVGETTNSQTVREHLHAVAERIEKELGEERLPRDFAPLETIAGRSVVAFRRAEGDTVPPPKCFGFVQTHRQKPRQRLWEVMKSQGMRENQKVVFMSDGGEDVRQVQEYLHPNSEHLLDWFHITMRLTVLQQQTKALRVEREGEGAEASKQIESVKHLLWHGNVDEALDRIDSLFMDTTVRLKYLSDWEPSRNQRSSGNLGFFDLKVFSGWEGIEAAHNGVVPIADNEG